jgi:Tol biopolymer transport system component
MMTRKRWIAVGTTLAVLCLVLSARGAAVLGHTIPGVARLLRGDPPAPTAIPVGERNLAGLLPTATLTAAPTQAATEVPSPAFTPLTTATTAQPTDLSEPAASLTVTPTWTAIPTPTWTVSSTSAPPTATPRPQWIAFESSRGAYGDYEIMVMAPDGSRQTNLTMSWADDLAPTWAPDGRHLVFSKTVSYKSALYVLDVLTGNVTTLGLNLSDCVEPAWSR